MDTIGTASKAWLLEEIKKYRENADIFSEENVGLEIAEEIVKNAPNAITDEPPEQGAHIIAFFSFASGATYCSDIYYDEEDSEGIVGWLPFPEEFRVEPEDIDDYLFEDSLDEGYDPSYYDYDVDEIIEEEGMHMPELGNLLFGNSRGEYPIEDRDFWQDMFQSYLITDGLFDDYGFYYGEEPEKRTSRGGYENDVFILNPYYWGDDEEVAAEPNFVYKPTGFELQWYKYPCRDAYANMDLDEDEIEAMFEDCAKSMEGDKRPVKTEVK